MLIKEIMPLLKIHGRTVYDEEKQALYCDWSCSGFSLGVKGTYLKARILADSDQLEGFPGMPQPPADWPCVAVAIGDELTFRYECRESEQWVTLWESTEEKSETLRVMKLSENARGKMAFAELETDGEIFKVEDDRPVMEIIGDSITCGYGNEAPNNAFEFKTMEENGWITYGALAARELGYDFSMVCESGISASNPEHPMFPMHAMDDIYRYTDEMYAKKYGKDLEDWDFKKHHNDIVVINLGTNDSNPIRFYRDFNQIEAMENWFHKQYKAFVQQVRELNGPDTYICCSLGSMDYYLYYHIRDVVNEIKSETGDEKICCFEYIPINMMFEGYGAAGHPSAKTHARMGKELAAYIRKFVLGE